MMLDRDVELAWLAVASFERVAGVVLARSTGTDLDAIHLSRAGIPSASIGLPLRYMHSPVEMVDLDDVANAAKLVAAAAQRLTAETSFLR